MTHLSASQAIAGDPSTLAQDTMLSRSPLESRNIKEAATLNYFRWLLQAICQHESTVAIGNSRLQKVFPDTLLLNPVTSLSIRCGSQAGQSR